MQTSGTAASLRGVAAVNSSVAWASGTGGTWLRTTDGGATWQSHTVPGAEALDFRGIHALDAQTAWLLSSGPGDQSRVYQTTDGGATWRLQFTNPDAAGFFDALAFWDARHGIIAGDPVDGRITIFTTEDGGSHWARQKTPPALPEEGAFAASGSCLVVAGTQDAWLGTGGPGGARVYRSKDRGRSWSVASTPLRHDSASAGIFSLAFADANHGVAVGGDYRRPTETAGNIAITTDGGITWKALPGPAPAGFRSAIAYIAGRKIWIVTGTSGSDILAGNGSSWKQFDDGDFNALSFLPGGAGWAVGPRGRIARFQPE